MNIVANITVLIGICLIAFFIFQLIWTVSNRQYIENFNTVYNKLEYSFNPNFIFPDNVIYDPNQNVTNVNEKFRCVLDTSDGLWYGLSIYGYVSGSSINRTLSFISENDCIFNSGIFRSNTFIVYDACKLDPTGTDCAFIKKSLEQESD